MHQELLTALIAGLGGMFGWGLADFFAKKTIYRVGSIFSLVWGHFFGTVILILVVLYDLLVIKGTIVFPTDIGVLGILIFFGALQAVVYLLLYIGFGKGQLAVLNPIFASYSGLVAVISIVVFGEQVNPQLLVALVVIFGGVLLLSIDIKGLKSSKRLDFSHIPGFKEVLIASILAALWTVGWDKFVGGQDWISYALLMYAFMTLTAFVIAKFQKEKLTMKKNAPWIFLILIGLCEVIAYLAISLGYSTTSLTSIVAVLSGAFSLPTIILARVFLKEKVSTIQTIGTAIIIIGIIILSLN